MNVIRLHQISPSSMCWRNFQKRSWRRYISNASFIFVFIVWLYLKSSSEEARNSHLVHPLSKTNGKLLLGNNNIDDGHTGHHHPPWIVRKLLTSTGRYYGPILTYDFSRPVTIEDSSNWTCINTSTRPSFPICIYDPTQDRYVSAQLLSEGVWEPHLVKIFQEALRYYPKATVIDLGAHIGSYALLAANSGHPVVAVEPMYRSIARLHKATHMSNTSNSIVMIPAAVSDTRQVVTLKYKTGNVGGTSVRPVDPSEINEIIKRDKFGVVEAVTLNDLADAVLNSSLPSTTIMKIDIEGYECKALAASHRLFDKHFVAYIFMEWETMFKNRHRYWAACQPSQLQATVDGLLERGYRPFAAKTGHLLDPNTAATEWRIGDVIWRHENAHRLHIER